jgi:serine/threonine-protein kinase PRP4
LKLKKNQKLDEAQKRKLYQFKDLLDKMLVIDPTKRITPKEALQHEFIKAPL